MEPTKEIEEAKEHEHEYFPSRIYECNNYCFVIVILKCDGCGDEIWDSAKEIEMD